MQHVPANGNQSTVASSTDNDPDFTDGFCSFLQRSVANVDAADELQQGGVVARDADKRLRYRPSQSNDGYVATLAPATS